MIGYLQPNGTLTFKKCYYDKDSYGLDWLLSYKSNRRGYDKLESKKGKGSRTYKMSPLIRRKIENATHMMRHYQKTHNENEKTLSKQWSIKVLTLTFSSMSPILMYLETKTPNEALSDFLDHLKKINILKYYWWVKEIHPQHYENTGEKQPHYHLLVCVQKYTTKKEIMKQWQNQVGDETIISKFEPIRVRNKFKSFTYQITMYVSKYCTKAIDSFNDRIYAMSEKLNHTSFPVLNKVFIKNILKSISQNENLTEDDIIYYRTHWNQAYLKKNNVQTYLRLKKKAKKDVLYNMLYQFDENNNTLTPKQKKESSQSESQAEYVREVKKNPQQKLKLEKKFIY